MPDGFFSLNNPTFLGIMMRFAINLFFLFILIRVIYFTYAQKEKFVFSFFIMGIVAFLICSMLGQVMMTMTFAFGVFAVFGILRLKTRNFSVKDMAYTFATFGISVINSLDVLKFPMLGILIINIIIILAAYILEEFLIKHRSDSYSITYENLKLLMPDKEQELLQDLSVITGKNILRFKIQNVNYSKKIANLEIFFKD
jgi:hypothetical protein